MIRAAGSDADFEAYVGVWNAITPRELTSTAFIRDRLARQPEGRLYLLAEEAGSVVGCGFAGRSDSPGRGFLSPRVLPHARHRGIGAALLRALADHLAAHGFGTASAHVDGNDGGSLAFAARFGFEETDRQVEQVRSVGDETPAEAPEGLRFVTIAERPDLLREAYVLAAQGYADMATSYPVVISLEDWLRDEATLSGGSFVALAGDEIVGYSGLCRRDDGTVEDGLTVVKREWRRRGLATVLKRAELAWAAANGVREIVTWTQRENEGMRAVNERLGYVYRSVTISVRAALPLP